MATFILQNCGDDLSIDEKSVSGNPDFGFEIADIDPYRDRQWSARSLDRFGDVVAAQLADCSIRIEKELLSNLNKPTLAPWMQPMLEKMQGASEEFMILTKLTAMIRIAIIQGGTLIFIGD